MNVIADYDQFFRLIVTKTHIELVFRKTHIFQTFKNKNFIFQTRYSGENYLCSRPVSVLATYTYKIWEPVLPAVLHNGHKRTFK